jgi:diphthamide synthase (EF-2-diphthine--ammonia ligase)
MLSGGKDSFCLYYWMLRIILEYVEDINMLKKGHLNGNRIFKDKWTGEVQKETEINITNIKI